MRCLLAWQTIQNTIPRTQNHQFRVSITSHIIFRVHFVETNEITMHAGSIVLALFLSLCSIPSAQAQSEISIKLPACVTTCYGLAIARASCDTLNPSCICGSKTFLSAVSTCLQTGDGTCTPSEVAEVWQNLQAQCADKISVFNPVPVFTQTDATSVTQGVTTSNPTESSDGANSSTGVPESSEGTVISTIGNPTTGTDNSIATGSPLNTEPTTPPNESTASKTQGSQTNGGQTTSTGTPSAATHSILPSIVALVLGSFLTGCLLLFAN
ncbi:hypothetical protein TWF694_002177 [Orbilia ellipsospora]|uniref:CFEM domain-containing protein n=1 Tax=Orbilia ellipsospora TaxID=2528407 RepID=A0AAV9X5Z9_9PEZI